MKNNNKAFTLVELIVVITILAILWTIAFISLQWYSADSRDSVRISDVSSLKTTLELFYLDAWKYPETTNWFTVTYSWSEVWTQWTFWKDTFMNISKLDKIPNDPLTSKEYTYSVTKNKQEYQFAWIMESNWLVINSNILEANAWDITATALVTWTYNWQVIKTQTWTNCEMLSLPSIISSAPDTTTNLIDILNNNNLVYNWYKNLPTDYISSRYKTDWWFMFTSNKLVVYNDSDSCSSLSNSSDSSSRLQLLKNLQQAYSWTIISNNDSISGLIDLWNIDLANPDVNEINMASLIVNNSIWANLPVLTSSSSNSWTPVSSFKWRSVFDNTYFTSYEAESWATQWWWSSSWWISWVSSYNVHLKPTWTWKTWFRPTKIRVTHNSKTPWSLYLNSNTFNNYVSWTEMDLDFSDNNDISNFNLDYFDNPEAVTNIEFYTDANIWVESTTTPVVNHWTDFTWNTYWQCNSNCYWNWTNFAESWPWLTLKTLWTWASMYKPTKIRVKFSWAGTIQLSVWLLSWWYDFWECNSYASNWECEINVTWTIQRINVYGNVSSVVIESIEFYN